MGKTAGFSAPSGLAPPAPAQKSNPAPQKVSCLPPGPPLGREQAPLEPAIPVPRRCPAAQLEAPGTHPRGLELLPHVAVPGAPLVPVRGWEGDVTLTWEPRHGGGIGTSIPACPHSCNQLGRGPTGCHGPHPGLTRMAGTPDCPPASTLLGCRAQGPAPGGLAWCTSRSPRAFGTSHRAVPGQGTTVCRRWHRERSAGTLGAAVLVGGAALLPLHSLNRRNTLFFSRSRLS